MSTMKEKKSFSPFLTICNPVYMDSKGIKKGFTPKRSR